jgi:predicted alpha/beta superfamily hydrolase
MKHAYLLLLFSISSFSQKTIETFKSDKLGESREITIGLPPSYEKNPTKKYPILVLLDGDYLFDPFYGALSYGSYWDDIPEVIIVGIGQNKNDERIEDSTYDEAEDYPQEKELNFLNLLVVNYFLISKKNTA